MVTKSKSKVEPDSNDEGDAGDEEPNDDKDVEGGDGDATGGGDLESHIRKVVSEVVNAVLGERPETGKTGPAQDENAIFRMVKQAQESLRKEEEKDSRFKEVAETVENLKKVTERAPARSGFGGRLQRAMWGGPE